MDKIKNKMNMNSMSISNKRLLQFINLFKAKSGKTLSGSEALILAETLLRTISIIYKPISISDYASVLAKKMFLKTRKV